MIARRTKPAERRAAASHIARELEAAPDDRGANQLRELELAMLADALDPADQQLQDILDWQAKQYGI